MKTKPEQSQLQIGVEEDSRHGFEELRFSRHRLEQRGLGGLAVVGGMVGES